jgi:hypothetical protein
MMSGILRILLISAFSRLMIAGGVFAGTKKPYQLLTPYPGTVSAMEGSSGKSGWRLGESTARARSLPAFHIPTWALAVLKLN